MEEKVEIKKIDSLGSIEKTLKKFDNIFPINISEKINLKEYSHKLFKFAKTYKVFMNSECIGFISFYINENSKISYLTLLAIEKKFQGKGIGKMLIKLFEQISIENKMEIMELEVFNENKKAIKFYEKNGFNFFKKSSNQEIYMRKKI